MPSPSSPLRSPGRRRRCKARSPAPVTTNSDLTKLNTAVGQPPDALPSVAVGLGAKTNSFGILIAWDGSGPLINANIAAGLLPGIVAPAPAENLSLLLSTDIVSDKVTQAIMAALTGDLRLDGGLTPQWSEAPGQAKLEIDFQGTKKDRCKLPVVGLPLKDISFDAKVDLTVSLPPPSAGAGADLHSDGTFDFTLRPDDVVECSIILGALAGVAGAIAGFTLGGPIGQAIGGAADKEPTARRY